ncbi:hypothetical protein ScPMuIL_014581 [Solemya velum]
MSVNLGDLKEKYKVHAETLEYVQIRSEANVKPYDELSVEEAREASLKVVQLFAGNIEFDGTVKEFPVPSIHCTDGIPVTVYRSKTCDSVVAPSVFVYFHGGGNVIGSRKAVDVICRYFSDKAPCVVVNVEYRLAPEYKFPANHEDAKSVLRWLKESLIFTGAVNESTIGVGGDSAGGRIAATACHEVKNISYQVLIYPNVDMRFDYDSVREFENGPVLSKEQLDWFISHYLPESERENPRASPILQPKFDHLPPALFIVAELDPLRDMSYAYSEKLKKAGVPTTVFPVKGVTHGFFHLPGHFKDCCDRAHLKVANFIKTHSIDVRK